MMIVYYFFVETEEKNRTFGSRYGTGFSSGKLPYPSNDYKECENLQKVNNTFFESTPEKFDMIETENEVKNKLFQ